MREVITTVVVIVSGLFGGVFAVTGPTYQLGQEAQALITECEKTLPRNQHCVIKAEAENVPH